MKKLTKMGKPTKVLILFLLVVLIFSVTACDTNCKTTRTCYWEYADLNGDGKDEPYKVCYDEEKCTRVGKANDDKGVSSVWK